MKKRLSSLALSCVLANSGAALADSDQLGVQLLKRMSHSVQEQSYDGIFVYKRGASMGSVRVIHVVKDGKESERVIHLDGPARELVVSAHDIGCVHPSARMLRSPVAQPANGKAHAYDEQHSGQLSRYYLFTMAGDGRVAGRAVRKLHIEPRDGHRFGYHLYLDKQSDLLLKSATVDSRRKVLESFQFTQINIGASVDEANLQPESNDAEIREYHSLSKPHIALGAGEHAAWRASWIPAGFVMAADAQRKLDGADMQSMHYTDGLAMFSVFVEPAGESTPVFQQRQGSTVVYSKSERDGSHWHTITVIGEVPSATAEQIADGVRPHETLAQ